MVVRQYDARIPCGAANFAEAGDLQALQEKSVCSYLISVGITVFSSEVLDRVPHDFFL